MNKLLDEPERIMAGSKQLSDKYPVVLEFTYEIDTAVAQPLDVFTTNGNNKHRWDPIASRALHAIKSDSLDIVMTWINNGFNINHQFPEYRNATMLHLAARHGTARAIDFLASYGARFDTPDSDQKTPLQIMTARSSGDSTPSKDGKDERELFVDDGTNIWSQDLLFDW